MSPVSAYLETLGVLILAVGGALLGHTTARWRWPWWGSAYALCLLVVTAIATARWLPQLEPTIPFRWLMAGRTEFAVLGCLVTSLLTIPTVRLPHLRQRVLTRSFMWLVVIIYSILPFLLPGLTFTYLRQLKTTVDSVGICLQRTGYTCGPAAAVTALRQFGIHAEEGELAILAHTTKVSGTQADSLCSAMVQRYGAAGIRADVRTFQSLADVHQFPVIAVVKYSFLVDHYVTILSVTERTVELGDPLEGRVVLSHEAFLAKWKRSGIVLARANAGR